MRWKRRRSIWPPLVALVCLLLMTMAAPRVWRGYQERLRQAAGPAATVVEAKPQAAVVGNGRVETPIAPLAEPLPSLPPPLPPVVRQGARHNAPDESLVAPVVGPILGSDEYDDYTFDATEEYTVVDDSSEPTTPPVSFHPLTSAVSNQLVAAPRHIQQYGLNTLLEMQSAWDSLIEGAEQAKQAEEAKQAARVRQAPRPQVRVRSSNDRLAMLPRERSVLITPRVKETPPTGTKPTPAMLTPTKPTEHVPSDTVLMKLPEVSEPRLARAEPRLSQSGPQPAPPALSTRPEALIADLTELTKLSLSHQWAERTLHRVEALATQPNQNTALETIDELAELSERGTELAKETTDLALRSSWLRTSGALQRRLPLWRAALDEEVSLAALVSDAALNHEQFTAILHEIAALTAGSDDGTHWREYLLLDELAQLATQQSTSEQTQITRHMQRQTAQRVLARMADLRLSSEQRDFLASEPLAALSLELQKWSAGPVQLTRLVELVEVYEAKPTMRYALAIAQYRQRLLWSSDARLRNLGEHLNAAYRKPNLRLAVTGDLLNRLTPEAQPVTTPVRDRVGGADIRGRARTTTDVSIALSPDPNAWRIALKADGKVHSQTYSDTWPAKVHNAGDMNFSAEKEIVISRDGLQAEPAEATARGRNRLVGIESNFEPVPLLGPLVESIARSKHKKSQPSAMRKVKSKVIREAETRMNRVADERLTEIESGFKKYVQGPLETLALAAEPVDLYTTEKRAVMRLRMADQAQLGAYTPRPSAPSDSLASLQLHESALNNAARGLGLDGQRMTAGVLHALLSMKLTGKVADLPEDLPARAKIEFAKSDAVRIRCDGDRLELCLSFAELSRGRDRIRNFEVHAFFKPRLDGLQVKLVRDGTLQFAGPRLRTGPRVVLHSVFGRLLNKDQELPLLAERLQDDSRFTGLMVTQLVIEDGWIAMALGPYHPERTAWRTREIAKTKVADHSQNDETPLR
ncbi:hypothetical protein [Adhaeretor mobilis]|uniref:Uncharacterized protein n=1 Tax=Adhaeretor mobilis TaxID=1930276 RepID=A0A517MQK4_9BACT|nr:hypothetical protein [Adhaeretor mobilis]QDS97169.1 hypothetical protein HG15A2_04290 [Adhaeretor mobilis]